MCLSNVYRLNAANERELLMKNAASMAMKDGKLIFTNLMGSRAVFEGTIETVDLINNYILIRPAEQTD